MFKNMRESLSEQADIHLRQQALRSLARMRNKQLRESLDHRIKRGRKGGVEGCLTRAEWASLHKQEIAHIRVQLADLQLERARACRQLRELKRVKARARRLKASQAQRKRK